MLKLAQRCEREVRRLIGPRLASLGLRLQLQPRRAVRLADTLFAGLPDTDSEPLLLPRITRLLLYRRFLEAAPKRRLTADDVPAWLVAGVVYRAMTHDAAAFRTPDFVVPRLLLEKDKLPRLGELVDQPASPKHPLFYRLYAEYCGCLLRLFGREDAEFFTRLMELHDPGRKASANLFSLLRPHGAAASDIEAWHKREVEKTLYRIDLPGSYGRTREALEQLETVTILAPGEGGRYTIKQVHFEDVGAHLENYQHQRAAVDARIRDLYTLAHDSPILLRPALRLHVEAMQLFRNGRIVDSRARLADAREAFTKAYERGHKVREYLVREERDRLPSLPRLAPYFALLTGPTAGTAFERRVQVCLDSCERGGAAAGFE